MSVECVCEQCGKVFHRAPSLVGRFCSRECKSLSQKKEVTTGGVGVMVEVVCARCGGSFQTRRRRPSKFCSHSCAASHNQPADPTLPSYRQIVVDGKKKLEHRHVMEKHLGRELDFDEVVHHIDGNRRHNELPNLMILNHSSHAKQHHQEWKERRDV